MFFEKSRSIEELESISLDNIFLNNYLPKANGTYLKVYLLGYQKSMQAASEEKDNATFSHQSLAEMLEIPLSDVLDAWKYWESQGVIETHPLNIPSNQASRDQDSRGHFSVEFINLKEKYLLEHHHWKKSSNSEPENSEPANNIQSTSATPESTEPQFTKPESTEEESTEDHKNPYHCTPEELIEANKVPQIRTMFGEINKIINRSLYPNEKIEILSWFYNFNIEPPLIVKAYSFAKQKKNVSTVKYVGGIVRNWYDLDITSEKQLETHLESTKDRFSLYNRIFKALGFSNREPSEKEREIMDLWFDEFHFSTEIVLRACEESIKIANPNISYIHGVLKNWHKNQVKSLEDVENLRIASKKTTSRPSTKKNSREKFKTKFHLTDSRTSKYNAEELEAMILNRQNKK